LGGVDPLGLAKAALRRRVLAARDALSPARRRELSASLYGRLAALPEVCAARAVLAYASFGSEADSAPFLREVLAGGRALALPRVDRAARALRLHRVRDLVADLRPGVLGIAEPDPARCPPLELDEVDVVVTPGVAFDPAGGRLGHGAGYYDRLLAGRPPAAGRPRLVAPAFEVQVVDEVPMGPLDRRVDVVVTEHAVYVAAGRRPPK
jgi:5-formyltetrahydrofolate cyclo-ligase